MIAQTLGWIAISIITLRLGDIVGDWGRRQGRESPVAGKFGKVSSCSEAEAVQLSNG